MIRLANSPNPWALASRGTCPRCHRDVGVRANGLLRRHSPARGMAPCPGSRRTRPWPPYHLLGPYRGPCAICGYPDARHRLYDAIADDPGTDAVAVAAAHGVRPEVVEAIWEWEAGE